MGDNQSRLPDARTSYTSHVMLGDEVFVGSDDMVCAIVVGLLFKQGSLQVEIMWWDNRDLKERWVPATLVRLAAAGGDHV